MPTIRTIALGAAAFALVFAIALLLTWGPWTAAAWGFDGPTPNAPYYLSAAKILAGLTGMTGGIITLVGGFGMAALSAAFTMDHAEAA